MSQTPSMVKNMSASSRLRLKRTASTSSRRGDPSRCSCSGDFQEPGGAGESDPDALVRELKEKTDAEIEVDEWPSM